MRLMQAHVLVTGASRGIGAHLAEQAAARGALVTGVARSADALRDLAGRLGGRALPADLAVAADRAGLVARAEAAAGRPVDVLVSCAGLDALGGLLEVRPEDLADLFAVNLVAPAELTRQVLPGLVARGHGHVVTVSSGFSTVTAPGLVAYAASKAGLSHFHAGVRTELRGTGVGTTLVEPGPVHTDMWDHITTHGRAGSALSRFLRLGLARIVDPADLARKTWDAVERGDQHVVLPRRMTPVLAFGWIPRRVADLVLVGVPRR